MFDVLSVEDIMAVPLLDRKTLEEAIRVTFRPPTAMTMYHLVTLENKTVKGQFDNLLQVIEWQKQ